MTTTLLTSHRRIPPQGAHGGGPGAVGRNVVHRKNGDVVELGGNDMIEMQAGDTFVMETPGGGGFGKP